MIQFDLANDEINALFLAAWQAGCIALNDPIIGSEVNDVPVVYWQGTYPRDIPNGGTYWARLSKQTVGEEQATLSTCEGVPGQKRYNAFGLVFVQLFCPKIDTRAFDVGQRLAVIARNAFRGKKTPSGIWFQNTRINELPPEELYERFNVVTEFNYDEIG